MYKIKLGNIRLLLIMSVYFVICLSLTSINVKYSIDLYGLKFPFYILYAIFVLGIISVVDCIVEKKFVTRNAAYYICWILLEIAIILVMGLFKDVSYICVIDELIVFLVPFVLCVHIKKYSINKNSIIMMMVTVGNIVSMQVYIYTFFYRIAQQLLGWGANRFGTGSVRADTTMGAATSTSIYLYTIVVMCLYLLCQQLSNFKKKYIYCSLGVILFAQLLLQTRSGILMSAMIIVYFLFKSYNYKVNRNLIYAFGGGAFFIIAWKKDIILSFFSRFVGTNKMTAVSDSLRMQLMKEGINKWNDNILFGDGFGQGLARINQITRMSDAIGNPHNQYISFLIDFGLIGLLLFAVCGIIFFVSNYRNKTDKFLLVACIFLLLIAFNTETLLTQSLKNAIIVWNLVIIVVLDSCKKGEKNEEDSDIYTSRIGELRK